MQKQDCRKNDCFWTYPEVVGELQGKDSYAFIVKGASHRTGNIAWDNGNEAGCQQPCTLVPQLSSQQKGRDGGQATENWGQEHTYVPYMDRNVEQVQHLVDEACSHHKTWVNLGEGERRAEIIKNQQISFFYIQLY